MDEVKNILNNTTSNIDSHTLLQYAMGKLTTTEQHQVESTIATDDEFLNDAIEGLQATKNAQLELSIYEINKKVAKKLDLKVKKTKRKLSTANVTFITTLLILLFIALGYFIIHLLKHS